MSVLTASDALQVAMVRLRLERVPCRIVTRREMEDSAAARVIAVQPLTAIGKLVNFQHDQNSGIVWPFREDRCVVFCRTTLEPGDRAATYDVVRSLDTGYVLSDGVERQLVRETHGNELHFAALATRGLKGTWMSSGGGW